MLQARDIPSTNILLYPNGDDIAFMAYCNHSPKVWIVHASSSKCVQCDYPLVTQGIICKIVIKIYKMLHPTIPNDAIVRKTSTFHGVQRGSLITNLLILENPLLEEQYNLPQIKDFPTS
jgi:hypothetical protein